MALSKNEIVKKIDDFEFVLRDTVASTLHVYRTALMNSDASGNVKLSTDAASEIFAGVAVEELNQDSSASAGDNQVEMISKNSGKTIKVKLTGVTKANVGSKAYAKADDEVQLVGDATNDVEIGIIVNVADVTNYCYVRI